MFFAAAFVLAFVIGMPGLGLLACGVVLPRSAGAGENIGRRAGCILVALGGAMVAASGAIVLWSIYTIQTYCPSHVGNCD